MTKKDLTITLSLASICLLLFMALGAGYGNLFVNGDLRYKNQIGNGGFLIRNGDMRICQRQPVEGTIINGTWAGGGYTTSGYIIDGFQVGGSNTTTTTPDTCAWYSFASATDTPRLDGYAQATNYLQVTNALACPTFGADSYFSLAIKTEQQDILPYANQPVTLSMWTWCDTPINLQFDMRCAGATRSYCMSQQLTASTWTKISRTITLEGASNYGNVNGTSYGILIDILLAVGANKITASANQWVAGSYLGTATNNFCYTAGQKFRITNVKLEPGSYATPFVPAPYQQELARNQRYYERLVCGERYSALSIARVNAATTLESIVFYTSKRAIPTSIGIGANSAFATDIGATTGINVTLKATTSSYVQWTGHPSSTVGDCYVIYGTSATPSNDYIEIISEL